MYLTLHPINALKKRFQKTERSVKDLYSHQDGMERSDQSMVNLIAHFKSTPSMDILYFHSREKRTVLERTPALQTKQNPHR